METEFALSLGTQRWTLPAESDTITIGRASNADVRLPSDDQISRIHARLSRTGTTWTLHDESRNGTGLNGRRLAAPTPLTNNDRIHIGRSVLTFHDPTTADSPSRQVSPPPPTAGAAPPPTVAAAPSPTPTPVAPPPSTNQADQYASHESAWPADGSAPATPPVGAAPPPTSRPPDAPAPPTNQASQYPSHEPAWPADVGAATTPPAAGAPPHRDPSTSDGPPPSTNQAGQYPPDGFAWPADGGASTTPRAGAAPQRDANTPDAPAPPTNQADQYPSHEAAWPADEGASNRAGGPFASDGSGQSPFAPTDYDEGDSDVPEQSPYARDSLDTPAPPAPPNIPRRTDAPSNFPLFPDDIPGPEEPWAAYPSADNLEPARSPWDTPPSAQLEQPPWNESAGWPETNRLTEPPRRRPKAPKPRSTDPDDEEVGTVRLLRVLLIAAGVIILGILINLIITFFADGPSGALRWLVPPAIALVAAMIIALLDAAASKPRAATRLDVSIIIAIIVVLLGVGVGGFALTAGAEYVGGYLTGNESGEDRLIKPVAAKSDAGLTITVENVTYTSHFTRVEVKLVNASKQSMNVPLSATFVGADGEALRADAARSDWPGKIPAGGTEHGTITFKGHLPDSATTATLTLKSGGTTLTVSGLTLTA